MMNEPTVTDTRIDFQLAPLHPQAELETAIGKLLALLDTVILDAEVAGEISSKAHARNRRVRLALHDFASVLSQG